MTFQLFGWCVRIEVARSRRDFDWQWHCGRERAVPHALKRDLLRRVIKARQRPGAVTAHPAAGSV
jgi:hypothetical protein